MKKNILIVIVIIFTVFACTDDPINKDHSSPVYSSAYVDTETGDKIIATFNESIHTSAVGFIIKVNEVMQSIIDIEGSGSRYITFFLESSVSYDDDVTIEYDASLGNATNDADILLASFNPKTVINEIEATDFSVLLPNIPVAAKDDTVWLIIKTTNSSSTWPWDHKTAVVNMRLSAEPLTTPFDIIIYAPEDGDWLPSRPFGEGHYATLLSQTNMYQELKVVTWVKASTLSGTNMGYINLESTPVENIDINNAFQLQVDGMDYVEGDIVSSDYTLWYYFTADVQKEYKISINDNYNDSENFNGIVRGILFNSYLFEYSNLQAIRATYPLTISGVNTDEDVIFIRLDKSDLGGNLGTFQIIVEEQP